MHAHPVPPHHAKIPTEGIPSVAGKEANAMPTGDARPGISCAEPGHGIGRGWVGAGVQMTPSDPWRSRRTRC
eukprot:7151595-Pyramimonas_sp.AAC.1